MVKRKKSVFHDANSERIIKKYVVCEKALYTGEELESEVNLNSTIWRENQVLRIVHI